MGFACHRVGPEITTNIVDLRIIENQRERTWKRKLHSLRDARITTNSLDAVYFFCRTKPEPLTLNLKP